MTLRKSIRHIYKACKVKNSTEQVRELKPRVLTLVLEKANETPELRCTFKFIQKLSTRCFTIASFQTVNSKD